MKAVAKITAVTLAVLALLGGAGYYVLQSLSAPESETIAEAAEKAEKSLEGNGPLLESEVGMDEIELQIFLHRMTHQKIVATEKRGAIEMTPENIGNMLTVVQANYGQYEHSEFYEKALTAWQEGDFSNAVEVHNTIWEWHNGIVGRATGLMTAEQEEQFVQDHFR